MNKKLKPWFIAGAVCAVIEILVFLILFSGDGLSGMLVFGFFILSPVQAAVCIQFWCVVGYIGTAREIKKDRPGALPVLLWIYTAVVLAVILISWTGYHPNSFMGGLTGIVPSLMTLYCGIPDAGFLIWCIVLTVIRAKKSYDFHAHYDGSPCYEKHGKAFTAAFVGISLTQVLLLAFCAASDGITQLRQEWENTEERQAARACLESADVIIDYQNTGDYSGGIMGTSLHRNSAVINYSEKRVTFIYMMSGSRMESYLFEEKKRCSLRVQDTVPVPAGRAGKDLHHLLRQGHVGDDRRFSRNAGRNCSVRRYRKPPSRLRNNSHPGDSPRS